MEPSAQGGGARRADLEELFLSALPDVEGAVRFIARRNRLSVAEAEEFAAEARLALVDHDYRILAAFQGRSSLRTYLVTVLQRVFLDLQRRRLGKWRPSAEAVRLGPTAEKLERLLYRDGHSLSEALATLGADDSQEERDALATLASRIPVRVRVSEGSIDLDGADLADKRDANPEQQFHGRDVTARCQAVVERTLSGWPPEDRVLLRLRFEDGFSVADIARRLGLDQKGLYRRLDRLLGQLRVAIEGEGIGWADVEAAIERGHCHLRLPAFPVESGPARPSIEEARS